MADIRQSSPDAHVAALRAEVGAAFASISDTSPPLNWSRCGFRFRRSQGGGRCARWIRMCASRSASRGQIGMCLLRSRTPTHSCLNSMRRLTLFCIIEEFCCRNPITKVVFGRFREPGLPPREWFRIGIAEHDWQPAGFLATTPLARCRFWRSRRGCAFPDIDWRGPALTSGADFPRAGRS